MGNLTINQNGDNSHTNLNSGSGTMIINNTAGQVRTLEEASSDLRSWYSCVYLDKHINRTETQKLWQWVQLWEDVEEPMDRVTLLVGDAGTGKSVVMRDLLVLLEQNEIKTLGLKSDILFAENANLDDAVGVGDTVLSRLSEIAQSERVVLLVDQIDALSSTLSSNRKPLHSINSLINEICKNANVRVIVSCRPYDQQYDPSLERYNGRHIVSMSPLSEDDIDSTLQLAGIVIESDDKIIKQFLSNPLNLYLFCKVRNGNVFAGCRPSRTVLYEALWKQIVIDKSEETELVAADGLTKCLDAISSEMYKKQTLALSKVRIETMYPHEKAYLESNGLLVSIPGSTQIQFMHQSLYDYVYARLFYSKNLSIDEILNGIHQGLFIRLRLKQVLFYLRDVDEEAYLSNLNALLFTKLETGEDKYRYHLKHLMLSNIGFLDDLSDAEAHFIKTKILRDSDFYDVYTDSVNRKVGLSLLIDYIGGAKGFAKLPESMQLQLVNVCERVIYTDASFTLSFLKSIVVTSLSQQVLKALKSMMNRMPVDGACISDIKDLLGTLDDTPSSLDFEHLYVRMIPIDADYVSDRIIGYFDAVVSSLGENFSSHDINVGYEIDYILDELKKQNPIKACDTILKMIELVSRKSVPQMQDALPIKSSRVYFLFQRRERYGSFTDKLLNYVIDESEKEALNPLPNFAHLLRTLSLSDIASLVLIPVCAYKVNIREYIQDAFALSKRVIESEHVSSVLDYHAKELFKVLFPTLDKEQKDEIMSLLDNLHPAWEKSYSKEKINKQSPMSYLGYTRAHYYGVLSEEDLSDYPNARKFRDEKLRIYHSLDNYEPFKTSFKEGWSTIPAEKSSHFTVPELVKTMLEIKNDFSTNWDAPTKTGHALALKQQISERPNEIYDAYMQALDHSDLDLDYPLYGIEALFDCSYDQGKIDALVLKILTRYNGQLSEYNHGHVIQTCRLVDAYYKHQQRIPDQLFDFVCLVAKDWDDSEYKNANNLHQDYNDGINQVRGCAADALLHCYNDAVRYDQIFDALHAIAANGAISTRASVLFRLGVLIRAGKKRCLDLFLVLTKDYATSLLSLPLHNQNPLLYLIDDYFEELKPYFEACIANPETHKVNAYLLWIAYVRKIRDAEEMMYRLTDSSVEGRAALIKQLDQLCSPAYMPYILPVLYRYLDYDEPETAANYDWYFKDNIQRWDETERLQFLDKFVESKVCKYCSHCFMDYLLETSSKDPINVLKWLPSVYERKKGENSWECNPSKFIDILLSAYNSIVKYDKNDPVLDKAMNLLDEWLHNNSNRQYLYNCFKLLEE